MTPIKSLHISDEKSPMLYKNVVLLNLFLYFTFFSFYEKQSKSIFHFFARTKKRNKEMRRLKRRRTANAA